jgi:peptidoglycan/LPS O-acetylase OafA/YrhL
LTIVIRIWSNSHQAGLVLRGFLHDVFFVQSYFPGTYGHFWSLSVEEHFYILLPLTLYFMLQRSGPNEDDPFRFLPTLFMIVAIVELAARLLTTLWIPFTPRTHVMATHLRLDSLLFGVLLSYWSIFRGERFWRFVSPRYPLILCVGVLLITPMLEISNHSSWIFTYGITLNYLGFGAIMVGLLAFPLGSLPKTVQGFFRAIAYIGGFSYSIYLWHIPWMIVLWNYGVFRLRFMGVFSYTAGAILVGIVTSKLVEIPVLRLRERLFPAQGQPAAARLAATTVRPA